MQIPISYYPFIIASIFLIGYGIWFWKFKAEEYGNRKDDLDNESSYDIGDDL